MKNLSKYKKKKEGGNLDENEEKDINEKIKRLEQELDSKTKLKLKYLDSITITALVDFNTYSALYRGELVEYYLAPNNSLDKIVLSKTEKIEIIHNDQTKPSDKTNLEVSDKNIFIIPYSKVINLDVRFLFLRPKS